MMALAIADVVPLPSLSLTGFFRDSAACLTDSLALSPLSELFSTAFLPVCAPETASAVLLPVRPPARPAASVPSADIVCFSVSLFL